VSAEQYPQFKEFNRRVIKEPVAEINRVEVGTTSVVFMTLHV